MENPLAVTNPTNIDQVNLNNVQNRDVAKFFNNFFDIPLEVSSNIDTAIIGYFENITNSKEEARALASAVIYTSLKQERNPMKTLDEFKKLPQNVYQEYVAMFLNLERKGTSYLGVKINPIINNYVQRSILP